MMPLEIMIVDDSLIMTKKLGAMIQELGHKVARSCSNGEDAVREYAIIRPDLVLMDITMPGIDGIETTARIVAAHPGARVVMVTSHGQEAMVVRALDAGARGYVLKPVVKERLVDMMQRAIDQDARRAGGADSRRIRYV